MTNIKNKNTQTNSAVPVYFLSEIILFTSWITLIL